MDERCRELDRMQAHLRCTVNNHEETKEEEMKEKRGWEDKHTIDFTGNNERNCEDEPTPSSHGCGYVYHSSHEVHNLICNGQF